MSTTCCTAKTVGEFSYTLADTAGPFPGQCKEACAYTRDGEEGSLYCFAPGNLPVHCLTSESLSLAEGLAFYGTSVRYIKTVNYVACYDACEGTPNSVGFRYGINSKDCDILSDIDNIFVVDGFHSSLCIKDEGIEQR